MTGSGSSSAYTLLVGVSRAASHGRGITAADFTEAIDPRPETKNTTAHFAAWRAVLQAMVNLRQHPSAGERVADEASVSNRAEHCRR